MAQWYIQIGHHTQGPFTSQQLRERAKSGSLTPADKIRKGEDGQWVTASHVRGLFEEASAPQTVETVSPSSQSSNPRWQEKGERSQVTGSEEVDAVWWYKAGGFLGAECGPLSASGIRELAHAGKITRNTEVRHDLQTDWNSADSWPWIFDESLEPHFVEKETEPTCESAYITNPDAIIVTTCDVKCDYEIIGPVYFQLSNQGMFSREFTQLSTQYEEESQHDRDQLSRALVEGGGFHGKWKTHASTFARAFFISVQELRKRAAMLGADAIVGLRNDLNVDTNDFQFFCLQMYGTAVKFTELPEHH